MPSDDVEVRVDRDGAVTLDYWWGADVHVELGFRVAFGPRNRPPVRRHEVKGTVVRSTDGPVHKKRCRGPAPAPKPELVFAEARGQRSGSAGYAPLLGDQFGSQSVSCAWPKTLKCPARRVSPTIIRAAPGVGGDSHHRVRGRMERWECRPCCGISMAPWPRDQARGAPACSRYLTRIFLLTGSRGPRSPSPSVMVSPGTSGTSCTTTVATPTTGGSRSWRWSPMPSSGPGPPRRSLRRWRRSSASHSWTPPAGQVYPDSVEALERSASAGWRNVIVSNHVPELPDLVDSLGLGEHVHAVLTSARHGHEKPHPGAFRLALEAAGGPTTVWMVGDNPIADIAGAAQLGIPGVLTRAPELDRGSVQRLEASYGGSCFPGWQQHCHKRAATAIEAVELILGNRPRPKALAGLTLASHLSAAKSR